MPALTKPTPMPPTQPPSSKPIDDAITEFLTAGNKSPNYRNTLQHVLTQWHDRLTARDTHTIDDITKRDLATYARYLSQRSTAGQTPDADGGITTSTAWTYYDCVSAFLSYCVRWEYRAENPAQKGLALDEMPPRPTSNSSDQQFWTPEKRTAIIQYVDTRAHNAVDTTPEDAIDELRDRALVYLLAYSGVRGAEILSDPRDDRRNGLHWADINRDQNVVTVLGKNQQLEKTQLPPQTQPALNRLEQALNPPTDDWPVFPTSHAPTLYTALPDDIDTSRADPLELHREAGTVPPSLSTNGARTVMQRLCEDANVHIDGDYLKPHGGRRGVGEAMFRNKGPAAAQRTLRHADPRTTSQQYSHIEAGELAEEVGDVFDEE
jgi:integrase